MKTPYCKLLMCSEWLLCIFQRRKCDVYGCRDEFGVVISDPNENDEPRVLHVEHKVGLPANVLGTLYVWSFKQFVMQRKRSAAADEKAESVDQTLHDVTRIMLLLNADHNAAWHTRYASAGCMLRHPCCFSFWSCACRRSFCCHAARRSSIVYQRINSKRRWIKS